MGAAVSARCASRIQSAAPCAAGKRVLQIHRRNFHHSFLPEGKILRSLRSKLLGAISFAHSAGPSFASHADARTCWVILSPQDRIKIASKIHQKNHVVLDSFLARLGLPLGPSWAPKMNQDRPKRRPRAAQEAPRSLQDPP